MVLFTFPEAPYFLFVAGLLASLTSGLAFGAVLRNSVNTYLSDRNPQALASLRGLTTQLPFLGICGGSCVFIASTVEFFTFSTKLSYALAVPLTLLLGVLVWRQLMQIVDELEAKGEKALEMDVL